MPTQAQIDANRRNAQKSTGPRTDTGKARSRWNALKFGFDAKSIVLPCEDPAEFDQLRQELLHQHQPFTVTQLAVVDIMTVALWNHRRYRRAHQQEFAAEHLRQKGNDWYKPAFPLTQPSLAGDTFVKLRRAAEAEYRTFSRAADQLRRLKRDEVPVPDEMPEEADAAPVEPEPKTAAEAPPTQESPERTQSAAPEPPMPPVITPHPIPPDSETGPQSPERRVA